MKTKLINITKGVGEFSEKTAEEMIVYSARVSSKRDDKFNSPEKLIKYCIDKGHWSIFEQCSMTIEIETSKAIGIQLLRHRSFSFQEFSQRYAEVQSFEPIELRKQCENNRQSSTEVIANIDSEFNLESSNFHDLFDTIAFHLETTQNLYQELLDKGIAKECARMILPMCSTTTIFMSGTVRSWIHFLAIRDDEHSQKEMQLIAKEIKKIFIQELPIISKSLDYV